MVPVKAYFWEGPATRFVHIATVNVPDTELSTTGILRYAVRALTNDKGKWSLPQWVHDQRNWDWSEDIELKIPYKEFQGQLIGHRSITLGDRLELGEKIFEIQSSGFVVVNP